MYHQLTLQIEHKSLSLGEVLDGDRMAKSLYKLKFLENLHRTNLCNLKLERKDIEHLTEAIEDQYYFEFIIDDLPIRNFIGYVEEGRLFPHTHKVFLWTHYDFTFEYNAKQIISVNVTMSEALELPENPDGPIEVPQSYGAKWTATDVKYENRLDRFKARKFFPASLEIHWLSIINSMVLAFLLVCFVVVILTRVVKKDFARYANEDISGIHLTMYKVIIKYDSSVN